MILSSLHHLLANNPDPRLRVGLEFLRTIDATLSEGKHDIAEGTFVMINEYETVAAETKQFEAHQNYIDIQMMITGREMAHWAPLDTLLPHTPYDEERDYGLHIPAQESSDIQAIHLHGNICAVYYPTDGHRPGLNWEAPAHIKKAVVKVPV